MRCEECRDKLARYGLGAAPAEEAAVRAHLAECAQCRAQLEAYERLGELLAPVERVRPERDLWPGVAIRLQPRRASVFAHLAQRWQPTLAAAAVLLAVAVGAVLYRNQPPAVNPGSELLAAGYQEQQIVAEWSQPLADDAALGLMFASLDTGEVSAP